jgi:hypothetical protein
VGYADSTVFLHPALYATRAGVPQEVMEIPPRR